MKRSKKSLLLLLLLLVCLGGYYGVQLMEEPASVTEESGSYPLTANTIESLCGMSWTQDETLMSFTLLDGVWTYTQDTAFPVNQEDLTAMAEDVLAVTATRKIENVEDVAGYGIDDSSFALTLTFADGTQAVYRMGAETPFGDEYYVHSSQDAALIYTIGEDMADLVDTSLNALAVIEEMPAVTEVTRIRLGDTLDVAKQEASGTIKPDQLWYNALTGQALSTELAEDLIDTAKGLAFETYVAAGATEEELISYGLAEENAIVLTLYNGDTADRTVLIGATDASGAYYARLPESDIVYTLSDEAGDVLSATAETLYDDEPLAVDFADIAEFTVMASGATHIIERAESVIAAEDGTESTLVSVKLNGEEADAAAMESLWELLSALSAEDRLATAAAGDAVLQLRVKAASGIEEAYTFTTYDADNYQVQTPDGSTLLVSAEAVDKIIRTVRQL